MLACKARHVSSILTIASALIAPNPLNHHILRVSIAVGVAPPRQITLSLQRESESIQGFALVASPSSEGVPYTVVKIADICTPRATLMSCGGSQEKLRPSAVMVVLRFRFVNG